MNRWKGETHRHNHSGGRPRTVPSCLSKPRIAKYVVPDEGLQNEWSPLLFCSTATGEIRLPLNGDKSYRENLPRQDKAMIPPQQSILRDKLAVMISSSRLIHTDFKRCKQHIPYLSVIPPWGHSRERTEVETERAAVKECCHPDYSNTHVLGGGHDRSFSAKTQACATHRLTQDKFLQHLVPEDWADVPRHISDNEN